MTDKIHNYFFLYEVQQPFFTVIQIIGSLLDDSIIIKRMQQISKKIYKNKHDWIRKVIHRELCKLLKFDYITKWYTPTPESFLGKTSPRIHWDFKTKTDHLISVKKWHSDSQQNKEKLPKSGRKERWVLRPFKRAEEAKERGSEGDIISSWCALNNPQWLGFLPRRFSN